MPLFWVLVGIVLLILLIVKFKLNTYVSLLVTAVFLALVLGIPVDKLDQLLKLVLVAN